MARYNLEISGAADEALEKLAEGAASKADAIRKAISVAAWVEQNQKDGKKLLVEDKDGRLREVHWR
jgi:hypothetical protein